MAYYLDIGKYKMSGYEELMNILKKIDEVQSGFDKEKYSVSSISWNIMDQVYA